VPHAQVSCAYSTQDVPAVHDLDVGRGIQAHLNMYVCVFTIFTVSPRQFDDEVCRD